MADNSSDSESSVSGGWTVVNDRGEVEASDSSSSTTSSLEFVQLEDNLALYQRRGPAERQEDRALRDQSELRGEEEEDQAVVGTVQEPGAGSNPDESEHAATTTTTAAADMSEMDLSGGVDQLAEWPGEDEPDGQESESDNQQVVEDPTPENDVTFEPTTPNSQGDPDLNLESCHVPPEAEEGKTVEEEEEPSDIHAGRVQDLHIGTTDSDTDSDFVKLDAHSLENVDMALQPLHLPRGEHPVEASASTSGTPGTSSSSISSNFRFVIPPVGAPLYRPSREEEEEDSLPGDFDDRCESDISGVATDDTDSDLSSMTYSIGDIPLTAGVRLYKHRPNPSLNSVLTAVSLLALCLAIGIGIGHYMGVSSESWLRQMQVERMKVAQDNHLLCLQHAGLLKDKLRRLNTLPKDICRPCTPGRASCGCPPDQGCTHLKNNEEPPGKDGPVSVEADTGKNTESKMEEHVKTLRAELNQVETENADLRAEVMRLRYTAHPANAHVSMDVTQRQLKVKVNQLAVENDDLKAAVGKMRYTDHPANGALEQEEFEEKVFLDSGPESSADVLNLQKELQGVIQELDSEKKMNVHLQEALQAMNTSLNAAKTTMEENGSVSVIHCLRHELPKLLNLTIEYLGKAGEKISDVTKVTQENVLQKVTDWVRLIESTDLKSISLTEDIKQVLRKAWSMNESDVEENKPAIQDGNNNQQEEDKTKAAVNIEERVKDNSTKPLGKHFSDYVNQTKETMSKLSNKLQQTWQLVRNLSTHMLEIPLKDTVSRVKEKIKEKVKVLQNIRRKPARPIVKATVQEEEGEVRDYEEEDEELVEYGKAEMEEPPAGHHRYHHPRNHRQGHHHGHHHNNNNKNKRSRHHHHHHHWQKENKQDFKGPFDSPVYEDTPKRFEDKPHHKQRHSSHEQYDDFWRKVEFDPDDFFHEGFFEGNQRQWQKHQKQLRRLHGRIHRLNEDILHSMDDDDIEDIYDDLDDLQDDLEDEDQPQTLQTWLACQVRWWKSRLQRKHRSEDLIKGCGRQIMQWQLRALCKDCCPGKKCGKRGHGVSRHPLCHDILKSQDSSCHKKGRSFKCHKGNTKQKKSFHSNPASSQKVQSEAYVPKMDSHPAHEKMPQKHPRNSPKYSSPRGRQSRDEEYLFMMEAPSQVPQTEEAKVNMTSEADEDEDSVDQPTGKTPMESGDTGRLPEEGEEENEDASWIFERAVLREYHHHNPDWVFKRAAERDRERNKPWYLVRAEGRADHHNLISHQDVKEYPSP